MVVKRRLRKKLRKLNSTYRIVQISNNHGWPLLTLDGVFQGFPGQWTSQAIRYPKGIKIPGQARVLCAKRNRRMRLEVGREVVVML